MGKYWGSDGFWEWEPYFGPGVWRESLVQVMAETESQDCCWKLTEGVVGSLREKWSK